PVVQFDDQGGVCLPVGLLLVNGLRLVSASEVQCGNVTLAEGDVTLPGPGVVGRIPVSDISDPDHRGEGAVADPEQAGSTAVVESVHLPHPLVPLEDDPVADAEGLLPHPGLFSELTGFLGPGPGQPVP